MSTPLADLAAHFGSERPTARPHVASFTQKDDGLYYGLVKHGTASSTTLGVGFPTEEKAVAHAQLAVDMLEQQEKLLGEED